MTTRMPTLIGAVEARWRVYGPDGGELPALQVVRGIAAETLGK